MVIKRPERTRKKENKLLENEKRKETSDEKRKDVKLC